MEYDFYQRIVPINKLIKVGRAFVPDNRSTWLFAVCKPIEMRLATDALTVPPHTTADEIRYERVRTITGDIFVANVTPDRLASHTNT